MTGDGPRYLHRDTSRNYTTDPFRAALRGPELVDADTQEAITRAAQQAARDEPACEWGKSLARVAGG